MCSLLSPCTFEKRTSIFFSSFPRFVCFVWLLVKLCEKDRFSRYTYASIFKMWWSGVYILAWRLTHERRLRLLSAGHSGVLKGCSASCSARFGQSTYLSTILPEGERKFERRRNIMDESPIPRCSLSPLQVGNTGRVVVSAKAIEAWLDHNMEAKRPVMARLAAALQKKAAKTATCSSGADETLTVLPLQSSPTEAGPSGDGRRKIEREQAVLPSTVVPSHSAGAGVAVGDGGGEGRGGGGEAPPARKPIAASAIPREIRSTFSRGGGGRSRRSSSGGGRSGNGIGGGSAFDSVGIDGVSSDRDPADESGTVPRGGTQKGSSTSTSSNRQKSENGSSSGSSSLSSIGSVSSASSSTSNSVAASRIVLPAGRSVRAAGSRASPESGRPRKRRSMAQAEASSESGMGGRS